ncbi:hypothetical protein HO173_008926 [Letharia columbiana]|uniref:Uncharacterized protein n=1 Tax=Letharia columbiana TaxID=112416 RepID=A0A8H6FQS1_9LECA|nr:uncharacterized protein HO173_008926 [Letharia columbiana]KAF6232963.1 hypothetical protein HO173_008926 [Letharia columbiana]
MDTLGENWWNHRMPACLRQRVNFRIPSRAPSHPASDIVEMEGAPEVRQRPTVTMGFRMVQQQAHSTASLIFKLTTPSTSAPSCNPALITMITCLRTSIAVNGRRSKPHSRRIGIGTGEPRNRGTMPSISREAEGTCAEMSDCGFYAIVEGRVMLWWQKNCSFS